jgi:tetratricopeptide (TPR) repeat protein
MSKLAIALGVGAMLLGGPAAAGSGAEVWNSYLDYAYVYSSADAAELSARLEGYGREAGVSLRDFIVEHYATQSVDAEKDDVAVRRRAIAYLLDYLARGEPDSLDESVRAVRELEDQLGRHENRYWYHYVLAHKALEKGQQYDFVGEVLDLWLDVVVPLEGPYESLHTLSLSESANSGFVSALPYVYENVARLVLIRSQKMGLDRDMDPLGAVVRALDDGRVGTHPDVIPLEASSKAYLDRVVERLEGPESDAGSLTFTLALFEASKQHEQARALLASEGLSEATLGAMRLTSGAYETALARAHTEQGRCAVYTRVLRQLGEVFAAKQRLGVDPEFESPFSIEGAIEVYATLHRGMPDGWAELGYAQTGPQAYHQAMQGLWQEIQEATLNMADYYLSRAVEAPHLADEHSRNAARLFARYLGFFLQFADEEGRAGVPDSAYFAAHEAARGIGDAYLAYAAHPTQKEVELATHRYRNALELFPFDRELWPALTAALERQGRETEYLSLVRPVAEWVTRSRSVATWIENDEPGSGDIAVLRRALGDTQVIMYLGFANADELPELEAGIAELRVKRDDTEARLRELVRQRDGSDEGFEPIPASIDEQEPGVSAGTDSAALGPLERAHLNREIGELSTLLGRLDQQLKARERALPLYKEALSTKGLIPELRAQRDHPVHTLLRRMYHEKRS